VIQAPPGVGAQIEERADVLHVLVARVQRPPAEQTMVLHDVVRSEQGSPLLPVLRRHGALETLQRRPGASVRGRLARGEVRVELGVGRLEVVEIEQHQRNGVATVVVGRWCGELDQERMRRMLDRESPEEADAPEQVLIENEEGGKLRPAALQR